MFSPSLSSPQLPPLTQKPPPFPPPDLLSTAATTPTPTPTPSRFKQLHCHRLKTGRLSVLGHTTIAGGNSPDIIAWNSHLNALASSPSPRDALLLFSRLRHHHSDLLPDTFTCSFVLKACSHLPDLPTGRAVHAIIEKLGFQSDLFLHNTVVHMYASSGATPDARHLFDKMPHRDVVTWNIIITHYTKVGDMVSARELFDRMPQRSVRSWTAMIAGYVQSKDPKEAIRIFHEMEDTGEKPNEVTVVAVLAACADLGALDLGEKVREYSDRCGFHNNVRVCNTLIDMYIKCGCLDKAQKVFEGMRERTVVSWSAMIGGFAMHGRGEEALQLFSKMKKIGIKPNAVTFLGLLHACSHMGLLEEGREFFTAMTKDYGIVPEIEHYGCMVDLLSRAGRLSEALEFIRSMPIAPNGVVWGALLGGARVHKTVEMGEEAIKHLRRLDPLNDGYYVVLSNIYAEAGRWEDAARVRRLMREEGVRKTPGWSTVAVGGVVHEFVAGDSEHPMAEEIYKKWEELVVEMRRRGYVPDTSVVVLDMEEERKEQVLYRHSEKLAVVFGLMSTPPGTTIRIMKNLRVCSDCHNAMKLVASITGREIIVRDRNRFHCFRDGECSCRDYW